MRDFVLAPEIEELRVSAERMAGRLLAPNVREAERAGRWPDDVMSALDGFPLSGLDLSESLGGVAAGVMAKVVVLETLAMADAGGLAGADRLGRSVGAVEACPDRKLANQVAMSCLDGSANSAFTVIDRDNGSVGLDWGPSWPPLRWISRWNVPCRA